MSSTVEQIKERLSIQDVVSSYIKLDRAGKNLKAVCPFHNEKTPSFYVSPERDSYYCFGCGAKGDIFTFVEEFEGIDFQGALKVLAERAGVEITYDASKKKGAKDRLYSALEDAALFFEQALKSNPEAQTYLKDRSLEGEIERAFRIGYAQDEWRTLYEHLKDKGYTDDELLRAGLIKKSTTAKIGLYDTFRGRIMFPIRDMSGRVIAFSGRVFPPLKEGEEPEGDRAAKYINNPETDVFHKGKILYGMYRAKAALRKYDFCVLVEGQTDVIASHTAGFSNTVAPLGTALTEGHLSLIKRFTTNLVLALDADSAGVRAAGRSAELALANGFDVKVAKLPEGKDPADVIKENTDTWKKAIRGATHIVDFMLEILKETTPDARKLKLEVHKHVLPYVARIENKIDQAHFAKRVAEALDVTEGVIYEEIAKVVFDTRDKVAAQETREVQKQQGRKDVLVRKALGLAVRHKDALDVTQLCNVLGITELDEMLKDYDVDELTFEADALFGEEGDVAKHFDELVRGLEEETLREKLAVYMHDLKKAEADNDVEKAKDILEKYQSLSEKIHKLRDVTYS